MKPKTTTCHIVLTTAQRAQTWNYLLSEFYRKITRKEILGNRKEEIFLAFPSDKVAGSFPVGKVFSPELLIETIEESAEVSYHDLLEKRGAMRAALNNIITQTVIDKALQKIEESHRYVVINVKSRTL